MDEDAIPPNRFCSAPPHSEPPPPLPPFSSITPSCAHDGIYGHRRSDRIQGIRAQTPKKQSNTDSRAAQKPSRQNPSPSKKQSERWNMVQASQSEQPRVESTHEREKQNQDGFGFSFASEQQNEQKDQKNTQKKTDVSAAENVVEQSFDNTTQTIDASKSDIDTCAGSAVGHAVESASAPMGWVIGPLFQSFKSKMASFTEIVMSPVKLFKANSPPPSTDHPDKLDECELGADGTPSFERSEPSDLSHPEAQSENANQDAKANQAFQQSLSEVGGAQNAQTVDIKYSKKLSFDEDLTSSEPVGECAVTGKEDVITDSVPLQHSPLPCVVSEEVSESIFRSSILLQPFVNASASHECRLEISSANDEQKGRLAARPKPQPRKCTANRRKVTSKALTSEVRKEESDPEVMDQQVSHIHSAKSNKADSTEIDEMLSLSSSGCFQPEDGRKTESCRSVHHSLQNNLEDNANGTTLMNPETYSAAGLGRAKRELKLDCDPKDFVKRKRLTVDASRKQTKNQELLNVASDSSVLRGQKPPRREAGSTNTTVDGKEALRPVRTRQAVSSRANKTGKGGQEILAPISEAVLNVKTESSSEAMSVCTLDKSCVVSEDKPKDSSKVKASGSCKRLKTRTGLGKPGVNTDNSMDLETTIAITSTKQAEQDALSDVLVCPDVKQLQIKRKCRDVNKKPLKRKSPNQVSSAAESDSTVVSTSSALSEPLGASPTDFNASQHVHEEESRKTGLKQSSKRPKKGIRGTASGGQETKQCIHSLHLKAKENQSQEGNRMDPVYFEMTPFESNRQPTPSPSQPHLDCYIQLSNVEHFVHDKEKDAASVEDEAFPSIRVSKLRSSARRVNIKPRRADNQRRNCRVLLGRTRKGDEVSSSITMDDADLGSADTHSAENGLSRRLLRSYSCPEIPCLQPFDAPWTSLHLPHPSRIHTPHQHQFSHTPLAHHAHKSLRRARRHTVCSIEVEREIAPLCLRKEVYPSRRSVPYDGASQNMSPSLALSPSTSLSALASCFLSSPLAFLSKKVESRGAASSPSTASHASSPTSSSSVYPLSPSSWHTSGFLQRTDSSSATMDSSSIGVPLECEIERRQQSEEEDDGENTSSSSQEFEDVGLREEKALSDSEIKVVQKHEERGKVSSIRIRKTLPKPQNNLTPMGLPKPIRLKKKEFSLEEIYTNKNFSKPPESRLETIFEVPLNRRNGSESWFGQRRLKRFLEFLEVGEARKPKKPLVGVGKAGISPSRTRRGGFPKDEPSLSAQDVDSLLCAKLDQLNLWLMHDQKDS
nr:microtubule-associated protein futsch isoform X2 [Scatophagus argus]XP_046270954.1 microtubule-associated protein futsch isoform X2 [Scatophagus argus]